MGRRLFQETMKAFVVVALAIAGVSADSAADAYTLGQVAAGVPWANAYYSGRAHNPGYVSHISYPTSNVYSAYNVFPYGGLHHAIGKREADSDADAYTIGQVAAGLPYANAVATGHAHNPGVITHTAYPLNNVYSNAVYNGVAHGYTAYNAYNAFPYGGFHHAIGKREADSDADAYTIGQVAAGL